MPPVPPASSRSFNSRLREEATPAYYPLFVAGNSFNSRLREEATTRMALALQPLKVSTHASVRRRPGKRITGAGTPCFNSRLREEATRRVAAPHLLTREFP